MNRQKVRSLSKNWCGKDFESVQWTVASDRVKNKAAMASMQPTAIQDPGLCGDCVHGRRIQSDRGSVFYQCQLSFSDSRFEKYPRLPVLQCGGYEKQAPRG